MLSIKYKKKIITGFLIIALLTAPQHSAMAGAWGESIGAELMHELWATIKEKIQGITMAQLKKQAINQVKKKTSELYSTTSSESGLAVADYNKFITQASKGEANAYMDDFFDKKLKNNANNSDYADEMIEKTRKAVRNESIGEDEEGGPNIPVKGDLKKNLFNENKGGGPDAFASMFSNDDNNSYSLFLEGVRVTEQKKEDEKEERKTEIISGQGFKTEAGDGSGLVTPGSVWAEMAKKAETAGIDALVNAQNMEEVIAMAGDNLAEGAVKEFTGKASALEDNILGSNPLSAVDSGAADKIQGIASVGATLAGCLAGGAGGFMAGMPIPVIGPIGGAIVGCITGGAAGYSATSF